MGRDTWRYRQQEREREQRKRKNPVWRGVGCLVITILAIGGYFFSGWFFRQNEINSWVYIPPEVLRPPFAAALPPGVFAQIVVALLFMMLSYGILSLAWAIFFPIQPGETDVPALKRARPLRRR
jgi:Zn-dependent protease